MNNFLFTFYVLLTELCNIIPYIVLNSEYIIAIIFNFL